MATIKDVARLAGVGLGTASRVVSGKGSVAPATAQRVQKAIEQLNFRPSHAARSLLSGSTQMIGVYIPLLKGTFYTPILQAIDAALRASRRHMVLAFGHGPEDERGQALDGVRFLIDRDCDGLIVMDNALLERDIVALGRQQSHIVVLNRVFESIRDQCFSADHTQGGVVAAQALLSKGHRRIAVIAGPRSSPDNVARIAGFQAEMSRHGVASDTIPMLESDFSPQGGWNGAQALHTKGVTFTALFCANDELAVGALAYLQQAGIAVPDQVSVMGYDDTQTAEFSSPRLTSVHVPLHEVTVAGVHCLLNRCYDVGLPVERKFPVGVTWRASVAPPSAP